MKPSSLSDWLLAADLKLSQRCLLTEDRSPWLYRLATLLAHAGDGVLVTGIGIVAWIVLPGARLGLMRSAIAVVACAALVALLKYAVKRERPLGSASARWSAAPKHDIYSFPSGHAARVACIAICFAILWPNALLGALVWALLVGVARVAVGAHHWLDVLVGWILGGAVAWVLTVILACFF